MNNSVSATATFTQRAALDAFSEDVEKAIKGMVQEFTRRRDFLVAELNGIPGIHCMKPEGAFYLFPNISSFGKTSKEIAGRLLTEAGVAVLPGTAFGANGEGFLRLSFANSMSNLETAVERIRKFVSTF